MLGGLSDRPAPAVEQMPETRVARFSSNVGLGTQVRGYSPRSRPVSYDLHRSLSVDCSVGRYYDPSTGQFLSVDPKVEQTLEAYLYAGDDHTEDPRVLASRGGGSPR